MNRKIVKRLVSLYIKRSYLAGREYGAEQTGLGLNQFKKEIEKNEIEILSVLPSTVEFMNEPKKLINFLKEQIQKDTQTFEINF